MRRYWRREAGEWAEPGADFLPFGASCSDEPDPRLAILGPPAVTRLMVELWRADPTIRSRFDLTNPLHRRDFALWMEMYGGSLGLDRPSIAAAAALPRRGS